MSNKQKPWIVTVEGGRTGKVELPELAADHDGVSVLRYGWMRTEQCGIQ